MVRKTGGILWKVTVCGFDPEHPIQFIGSQFYEIG